MRVSINQPAYLPWPGYFDRIVASDVHVVLDHVQFEKNSLVNRNRIRTAAGTAWLTVPVRTKGLFGNLPINELEVVEADRWRRKHMNTLQASYGRAPQFDRHRTFLEALLSDDAASPRLIDFTSLFLSEVVALLGIEAELAPSSRLGVSQRKSDLVLEICQKVGATEYLSGPLGRDYLDRETFRRAGVTVRFHDYAPAPYSQRHGEFIAGLSMIDMMMNVDPDRLRPLVEAGRLISDQ